VPAIIVSIEVSEIGLAAARADTAAYLSHLEAQPGPRAATSWLVIRRLVQQLNDETTKRQQEAQAKKPAPPTIRELRRAA
jgi:hypothetical protein